MGTWSSRDRDGLKWMCQVGPDGARVCTRVCDRDGTPERLIGGRSGGRGLSEADLPDPWAQVLVV